MSKLKPLALAASLAALSNMGTVAWADPPIATASGGDAPSSAPDSASGAANSSAASIAATSLDAPSNTGEGVAYVAPFFDPPFTAMEPHAAMMGAFGAIGGVAEALESMKEGKDMVAEYGIQDPTLSLERTIAAHLADELHGPVSVITIDAKHRRPSDLAALGAQAHARYVVFGATLMWGIIYYAMDLTHFHVTYFSMMELVDTKTGEKVMEAKCNYHPVKDQEDSTLSELTGNQAANLKAQMQHAADHCAAELIGKLPPV